MPTRRRWELRLQLPGAQLRKVATGAGAPLPGSRTGGTGKPRHSFRVDDALWGAAVNKAQAAGENWNGLLRGYCAAYLRGEAPVYPDPDAVEDEGVTE